MRRKRGSGTHLHFPDWESQGGETTHSLWNPGRSLGWIVDVFLRSTQPPSIFCIWRPLMLPSNGRWEGGEILGAFRKVRTFLGLVTLGGHHHENSVMLFLLPLRGWWYEMIYVGCVDFNRRYVWGALPVCAGGLANDMWVVWLLAVYQTLTSGCTSVHQISTWAYVMIYVYQHYTRDSRRKYIKCISKTHVYLMCAQCSPV